jgi:D-alanyl-lipoteichoic acid acyltransferase DltB (MBOAT superfamily)
MLFNSVQFFAFFAVVYVLYTSLDHKWQNRMLVAASWVFYGLWSWKSLFLLWTSIVVDYSVARALDRTEGAARRKLLLAVSMSAQLGLLAFFKYYNFFVDNLTALGHRFDVDLAYFRLDLLLPIGISFYTFHTMSYVIDVYHRKLESRRSLVDFALFVSFFPQLVAGPIARANQLLPQVEQPRRITHDQLVSGCFLIAWGLFKKVIIADSCGRIVNAVFANDTAFTGLDKLLALYAFAFQIYCDFSGYSDMALGLGRLMGFELTLNFNLPYFSTNPSEFWRRWHISLSSWLRDYLYIPLGGSRHGRGRTYFNLFLTMLLGGIWHGASWMMVLWGMYQGACLIVHRVVTGDRDRGQEHEKPVVQNVLQIVLMFQVTCVGWLIFRAESPGQIVRFLHSFVTDLTPSDSSWSYVRLMVTVVTPLLLFELGQYRRRTLNLFETWHARRRSVFAVAMGAVLITFLTFHRSLVQGEIPFIYFQF